MIAIFGGLFVAPILAGTIYVDTARRGLSVSRRLLLVALFGFGSVGGFLVPSVFTDQLIALYFAVRNPRPMAVTPLELLSISVATGVLISLLLGLVYTIGIRFSSVGTET